MCVSESVWLSVSVFVYVSMCLCVCLCVSVCLCVCLPMCLCLSLCYFHQAQELKLQVLPSHYRAFCLLLREEPTPKLGQAVTPACGI